MSEGYNNPRYNYDDLKSLMARLRDPVDGCPWDKEQDYRSIVPHTLEEVYEVIDTIERQDYGHLREELGDLLFQVVFYAQIAQEEERFTLDDVIHDLVAKLLFRHPHVFPEGTLASRAGTQQHQAKDITDQWDALKRAEKAKRTQTSAALLDDIPAALPALLRARKLQSRAAKVGFDWPSILPVIDKAHEELAELQEAIESGDRDQIESELGDLFFVLANVARHCDVDPEQAVRSTNQKFERRFSHVEARVNQSVKNWSEYRLEELDQFWLEAKQLEQK